MFLIEFSGLQVPLSVKDVDRGAETTVIEKVQVEPDSRDDVRQGLPLMMSKEPLIRNQPFMNGLRRSRVKKQVDGNLSFISDMLRIRGR